MYEILRIASEADVRTHGENKRFGIVTGTLILIIWDNPKPLFAFLQTVYEYFDRPLDFIRFSDHNV